MMASAAQTTCKLLKTMMVLLENSLAILSFSCWVLSLVGTEMKTALFADAVSAAIVVFEIATAAFQETCIMLCSIEFFLVSSQLGTSQAK